MTRKVLITGAAGFIGSRLAYYLDSLGYQVIGSDIFNFRNQFFDVGDTHHINLQRIKHDRLSHFLIKNDIPYFAVDISERDAVNRLFATTQPDVVVHLAAQAGVRHSVKAPMDFVKSNLTGFSNILDACHEFGIKEFLYASSSSVYGARTEAPFKEDDRCDRPESFYAATKMANEAMAKAYFAQYKMPSIGLRFFTVFGPWGRLDMAPILFAEKMRKKQAIQLFGQGLLQRDFTFVDDTVYAIEQLIRKNICQDKADVLNVGHSNPIQVKEFVETLSECLKVRPVIELADMQVSDVPLTCASEEKLIALIGEWPSTPLKDGLSQMCEWLNDWRPAPVTH